MSTITERFPFCYAFKGTVEIEEKDVEMIRLHILVNVPAGKKIIFPPAGTLSGQKKIFKIELDADATATTSIYKSQNYEFPIKEKAPDDDEEETIDTVEVYTQIKNSGTNRIKTMKTEVADMDVESGVWPPINHNVLLEAPYVCTKLIEMDEKIKGFTAEIYVKCATRKTFSVSHTKANDADENTEYKITSVDNLAGSLEYATPVHLFDIEDVHLTLGANSAVHGNKKGKTKNRNHTVTPFPSLVIKTQK